jgi:hypothetical protein
LADKEKTKMNRREFLRTLGRRLILAGGVVAGGLMLRRKKITLKKTGDGCINAQACGGCPIIGKCTRPAAKNYRGQHP